MLKTDKLCFALVLWNEKFEVGFVQNTPHFEYFFVSSLEDRVLNSGGEVNVFGAREVVPFTATLNKNFMHRRQIDTTY